MPHPRGEMRSLVERSFVWRESRGGKGVGDGRFCASGRGEHRKGMGGQQRKKSVTHTNKQGNGRANNVKVPFLIETCGCAVDVCVCVCVAGRPATFIADESFSFAAVATLESGSLVTGMVPSRDSSLL
jgi:hypothetical protein